MIVGPGRIRAVLDGIWRGGDGERFALVEMSETGLTVLAEDDCAQGFHVSSLGRTKSGDSAVLCQGFDGVAFGVFDEAHGRMDWRWTQALDTREPVITSVSYFADLGSKVVLIFERGRTKGVGFRSWNFMLAPGQDEGGNVCLDCEIIGLVVVGEQLRILSGVTRPFAELAISESGDGTELKPLRTATTVHGTMPAPCIAQERNGAVTVRVPLFVKYVAGEPQSNAPRESSIATFREEEAWLPHGPDVYPAEDMPCPPSHFEDPTRPALADDLRTWIRASRGERSQVIVYNLRALTIRGADLGRRFDPTEYAYPGSVRVVRQP